MNAHNQMAHISTSDSSARHDSQRRRYVRNTLQGAAALSLSASPLLKSFAQPISAAALEAKAPSLPKLGTALNVPRITLLDGTVFDPAKAEGQALLVYWWASTCPFCALQSPSMEKLWRSQKSRGLQMLALSIDVKPEPAIAYLKAKGYSFPAAWASPEWRSAFPKPQGLPVTLLRGRDGTLKLAEKGQLFAEDVDAIAGML